MSEESSQKKRYCTYLVLLVLLCSCPPCSCYWPHYHHCCHCYCCCSGCCHHHHCYLNQIYLLLVKWELVKEWGCQTWNKQTWTQDLAILWLSMPKKEGTHFWWLNGGQTTPMCTLSALTHQNHRKLFSKNSNYSDIKYSTKKLQINSRINWLTHHAFLRHHFLSIHVAHITSIA